MLKKIFRTKIIITLLFIHDINEINRMTEKIHRRMPTLRLEDIGKRAGLRVEALDGSTPALLLVTALCTVLALDKHLEEEVGPPTLTYSSFFY